MKILQYTIYSIYLVVFCILSLCLCKELKLFTISELCHELRVQLEVIIIYIHVSLGNLPCESFFYVGLF